MPTDLTETVRPVSAAALRALERDERELIRPLLLLALNFAVYTGLQAAILLSRAVTLKLLCGAAAGMVIATIFIIGHDAAHGSLTPYRRLNRLLGTLAFLPGLHPYSLWELGHNKIHHRFVAQLGKDNAWPPWTPAQYAVAPWWRRLYYRFDRSIPGQPFHYMLDIWLPSMIVPVKNVAPFRRIYAVDLALVIAFAAVFLAGLAEVRMALDPRLGWRLAAGEVALYNLAIPFLVWMAFISFLSVITHTHPQLRWRRPGGGASPAAVQIEGTVFVVFPEWLDWLLHRILHHQIHHAQPAMPLYKVKDGQRRILAAMRDAGNPAIVQRWTPAYHLDMTRRCKLYDPDADCWRDYAGRVTARPGA